ncbi:hypothetical protein BDA96_10G182100 [Sorghum bicolor]|uniref:Ubiquitin-like protease family profile domain-containing protein n=1 Tax=Sorghum bicolor TaxID=4558 RepID=A0A921Q2P8_SORBI|nr:hypothetical protein BDA96_10G182100 [Sorghum bicolor]
MRPYSDAGVHLSLLVLHNRKKGTHKFLHYDIIGNEKILLLSQAESTMLMHDKNGITRMLQYKLVFIPLNSHQLNAYDSDAGVHYSLLVLDNTRHMLHHYDTARPANQEVAKFISGRIKELNPAFAKDVCDAPVPQQEDSYNCGVYVMAITEAICEWFKKNEESAFDKMEYNAFVTSRVKQKGKDLRMKYYQMILKYKDELKNSQAQMLGAVMLPSSAQ